jgi:molecular chaperone Hsp33
MEKLNNPEPIVGNFVLPFQIEGNQLRGRIVRLSSALDVILAQHAYPAAVAHLLAEAMTIAAALGTALKYDGLFTLQVKSDGPVSLLVADVQSDGGIRAYARYDAAKLQQEGGLLGKGYLAFTVDQPLRNDRYQGIVELQEGELATAVQHYFKQSEQIATGIMTAVRQDAAGHWLSGCLLLQQMPQEGGFRPANDTGVEDQWLRALLLMETSTPEELTGPILPAEDLLFRLFHEDGVRIYDAKAFQHQCRCSEAKVINVLRSLPQAEVEAMAVDGVVSVTCEFCNRSYNFDAARRESIFASADVQT